MPDHMVAGVDVQDFAGDAARHRRQQIDRGLADLLGRHGAAQRRVEFVPAQDVAEVADPRGGQRLDRPGRNRVDADRLLAEVGGEIAHARLQRRLGDAHDVVVRHPFLGAVIGQRQQRAAVGHQLLRPLRERGEGIAGDRQRLVEIGFGGVDVAAGQFVLVGEGDAMDDEVEPAPQPVRLGEDRVDRRAVGDVAMAEHLRAEFLGERADALLQRLALIGQRDLGPGGAHRLGDPPGDRAIIGDAEDDPPQPAHDAFARTGLAMLLRHRHLAYPLAPRLVFGRRGALP